MRLKWQWAIWGDRGFTSIRPRSIAQGAGAVHQMRIELSHATLEENVNDAETCNVCRRCQQSPQAHLCDLHIRDGTVIYENMLHYPTDPLVHLAHLISWTSFVSGSNELCQCRSTLKCYCNNALSTLLKVTWRQHVRVPKWGASWICLVMFDRFFCEWISFCPTFCTVSLAHIDVNGKWSWIRSLKFSCTHSSRACAFDADASHFTCRRDFIGFFFLFVPVFSFTASVLLKTSSSPTGLS